MGLFSALKAPPAPEAAPAPGSSPQPSINSRQDCINRMEEALSAPKAKGVMIKFYLEGFKNLNDTFGYAFGEALLHEITQFLQQQTGSPVFRYIGVEYISILDHVTYSKALESVEQIIERFTRAWNIEGTDCLCSLHVGLAVYPGRADDAQQMVKMLDHAVSESLAVGPGTYIVYDDALHAKFCRRQNIAHALADSINHDTFSFFYRPTFCVGENRYTRAESAARLFVPGEGVVYAAEFIPVAEDSGQIISFQYLAIEKACILIRNLLDAGKYFESIAVPVSGVLFFQMDMANRVECLLAKYQIPPKKLAFEISESVMTTAYLNANIAMQELSDLGVEIILNEFGTGYSGISNILDLPVDVLKLERMFIWQLEISDRSCYVIEGLVGIARKLGIKLIAEGVETDHQHELLTQYGCGYEQGYYYTQAVPVDKLPALLEDI